VYSVRERERETYALEGKNEESKKSGLIVSHIHVRIHTHTHTHTHGMNLIHKTFPREIPSHPINTIPKARAGL
jgi:hypothetical protein